MFLQILAKIIIYAHVLDIYIYIYIYIYKLYIYNYINIYAIINLHSWIAQRSKVLDIMEHKITN